MFEPDDQMELTDPTIMRALAHPHRLALLRLLAREEKATATQLAPRVGISAPSATYHLNQLARFGLIEPAQGGRGGRDRPWRAVIRGFRWASGATANPDFAAAATLLRRQLIEHGLTALTAYEEEEERHPEDWREASFVITDAVELAPEDLSDIAEHIRAVLTRARRAQPSGNGRTRPVRLFAFGVPETPLGERSATVSSDREPSGTEENR